MLKAYCDSQVHISCRKLDSGVWNSGKKEIMAGEIKIGSHR